jgi:hypothetical protein
LDGTPTAMSQHPILTHMIFFTLQRTFIWAQQRHALINVEMFGATGSLAKLWTLLCPNATTANLHPRFFFG